MPEDDAARRMDVRPARPLEADPAVAERIGREALAKIGYIPIMNLARKAGWVAKKKREAAPQSGRALLAQTSAAGGFVEVFSKYAVVAGVTSQADSPLPGPGDAAAIGILVLGLVDAALLSGAILNAIAGATTTTVTTTSTTSPIATTMPIATTAPIATTMPIAKAEDDTREIKRRCYAMYTDCLGTPLADKRDTHGHTRCITCRDVCINNGGKWPARAKTTSGSVPCDY